MEEIKLPPPERAAKTAIGAGSSGKGTVGSYLKADALFSEKGGTKLDYGSGRGEGAKLIKADTYEPYVKSKPNYDDAKKIPSASYNKVTSLNVLNVLPPEARNEAVKNIGRILTVNGEAIVSTRGVKDVESAKTKVKARDGYIIGKGDDARFQKGFTTQELKNYIQKTLGKGFKVETVKGVGKAAVKIKKLNIPRGFGGVLRQEGTPVINIQEQLLYNPRRKFSQGGDNKMAKDIKDEDIKKAERQKQELPEKRPDDDMKLVSELASNPNVLGYNDSIIEFHTNPDKAINNPGNLLYYPPSEPNEESEKRAKLIDKMRGVKTVISKDDLKKNPSVGYKKGGVAQQMELFSEGGLKDEGGTVDPVSGNDVPPGSTQEEVRDDIPAQLSEGEFVFPADVVRYIGLEKLMKLRQEAKAGLKRMEEMGQMGNADEATLPDDIPFTIDDLDMDDDTIEANIGTFVPPKVPTATPYNPNVNPYTPTGVVPTTYAPYKPATGTSLLGASTQGVPETENRRYVNKTTGQVRMIPFNKATGQSLYPIPEGFIFEPEAPKEEAKTTKVQTAKVKPVDTGDGGDSGASTTSAVDPAGDPLSYSSLTNLDDLDKNLANIGRMQLGLLSPDIYSFGKNVATSARGLGNINNISLGAITGYYTSTKNDMGRKGVNVNTLSPTERMELNNSINAAKATVVEVSLDDQGNALSQDDIISNINTLAEVYGLDKTSKAQLSKELGRNFNLDVQLGKKLAEVIREREKNIKERGFETGTTPSTSMGLDSLGMGQQAGIQAGLTDTSKSDTGKGATASTDTVGGVGVSGDLGGSTGAGYGGGSEGVGESGPSGQGDPGGMGPTAKGGLARKKKPKVKKMKRGGLASR
jgi:hypothetical protein